MLRGLFEELRRRRVLPVAGAYAAGAWLVTEIASFLLEQTGAPDWALRLLAIVFVVGFPLAVALAWAIQRQPDGSWSFDPSRGQRRTLAGVVALGVLATIALSWLILPRMVDLRAGPAYQPIANSVALLPLATAIGTSRERSIAKSLYSALESGLDQSAELILMDLSNLHQTPEDPVAFGRSLKAATLLSGRILQEAGSIRIRMNLLDIARGEPAWSRMFEWDPTRIGDTSAAIANDVLQTLELPGLSATQFTGTGNLEAYDAFLVGLQRASSYNIADLAGAMDDFQRAIDLDPDYSLAYVALAETVGWYRRYRRPEREEAEELQQRARQALETAQKLAPDSADVVSAIGWLQTSRELRAEAARRALELDPNHAKSFHRLHWTARTPSESERLLRKALELEPFNADWYNDLATVLYNQGRKDEAYEALRRSIELEPNLVFNQYKMGLWVWGDHGRYDEAIIHLREAYRLDPDFPNLSLDIGALYGLMRAGEEALAWMQRAEDLLGDNAFLCFTYYQIHYALGEIETGREFLRRAVELDPTFPYSSYAQGFVDIQEGNPDRALRRWHQIDELLTAGSGRNINKNNLRDVVYFAGNLMAAGHTKRAEQLLQKALDFLREWQTQEIIRKSLVLEFETEIHAAGQRSEETLSAMRRMILEQRNYSGSWMFDSPAFDFLRDEPEFRELMALLEAEFVRQRERIREMERSGELAAAPGV